MKCTLLIALYIAILSSLSGQEFAPIGAKWNFESEKFQEGTSNSLYQSTGDTLIGIDTFRIVKKQKGTCNLYYPGNSYFRQTGDSIFWMHEFYPTPQLLFDFSAQKGDSWLVPHHYPLVNEALLESQYSLVVDSVYTTTFYPSTDVLTFDVTLSVAELDSQSILTYPTRFYQYIGFELGLLPKHHSGICDDERETAFRCYSDLAIGEIKLFNQNCTVTNTTNITMEEIQIVPNPTQSSFKITDIEGLDFDVEIYSMSGMNVEFERFGDIVYVGGILQGIYFVSLIHENKRLIRKLVIE